MKMKLTAQNIRNTALIIIFSLCVYSPAFTQTGAAINTTGAAANASAILDISSTTGGILIPRMTEAQKNAISAPATGLTIYQTDATTGFWHYNGSSWVQAIGPAGATGLLSSGASAGNTPYWDGNQWVVNSSNIYNNGGSVGINTSSPNVSAYLDISGTSKGFLIPRMTKAQRNAISTPSDGLQIYNTDNRCMEFYANGSWREGFCIENFNCGTSYVTFIYRGSSVTYGTVSGQNGTCWMDRNLGATAVATAYNHSNAYGDMFQWGRLDDGHQNRSSLMTTTLSGTDVPGHSKYITSTSGANYDWRNPMNSNLWQGLSGTNNPCPSGWRVPTESELNTEKASWGSQNYSGAFASPLKLTVGGYRDAGNGSLNNVDSGGFYWTSSTSTSYASYLYFGSTAYFTPYNRGSGMSVRCIKEY